MQHRKFSISSMTAGILALVVAGLALAVTQPAKACSEQSQKAQCGSQASSCKNCHEAQGKDPVNGDGSGWHQSHAFGDFCAICHGGNQQATDKDAAHAGMVAPLSDVKAACQQCHPNDLQARAQVYASALGVEIGAGTDATPARPTVSAPGASTATAQPALAQPAGLAPNDPNLVDYVQRYNEQALGQEAVNWGDAILLVLIGAMLLGGGALVLNNEKLVVVSFKDTKPVEGQYPADVVEMVPALARLKPAARKSLRRLLGKPDATADFLASIDKLTGDSPEGKNDSPSQAKKP